MQRGGWSEDGASRWCHGGAGGGRELWEQWVGQAMEDTVTQTGGLGGGQRGSGGRLDAYVVGCSEGGLGEVYRCMTGVGQGQRFGERGALAAPCYVWSHFYYPLFNRSDLREKPSRITTTVTFWWFLMDHSCCYCSSRLHRSYVTCSLPLPLLLHRLHRHLLLIPSPLLLLIPPSPPPVACPLPPLLPLPPPSPPYVGSSTLAAAFVATFCWFLHPCCCLRRRLLLAMAPLPLLPLPTDSAHVRAVYRT